MIFEEETEIGRCAWKSDRAELLEFAEPEYVPVYVQTVASRHRMILTIEHRCFQRRGQDLPDELWIKPKVLRQRAPAAVSEATDIARKLHDSFVNKIRARLPTESRF